MFPFVLIIAAIIIIFICYLYSTTCFSACNTVRHFLSSFTYWSKLTLVQMQIVIPHSWVRLHVVGVWKQNLIKSVDQVATSEMDFVHLKRLYGYNSFILALSLFCVVLQGLLSSFLSLFVPFLKRTTLHEHVQYSTYRRSKHLHDWKWSVRTIQLILFLPLDHILKKGKKWESRWHLPPATKH